MHVLPSRSTLIVVIRLYNVLCIRSDYSVGTVHTVSSANTAFNFLASFFFLPCGYLDLLAPRFSIS